ncbi:phage protein NinX family protein [Pseudomonas putida]|uniref:phage protein NinX family protein n=1 Tax=Pseudomonas putida TaxID=303 RepID=UPI003806F0CC
MHTQHEATASPVALPTGFVPFHINQLDGPALDWAVAQAAAIPVKILPAAPNDVVRAHWVTPHGFGSFRPSSDWSDAGPLLREFQVALYPEAHDGREGTEMSERWVANVYYEGGLQYTTEPCRNELIALCRAIVVTKFGETVSVPSDLGHEDKLAA